MSKFQKVLVLLASHNGMRWVDEQIQSIHAQRDVHAEVVVSDDLSTDGTLEYLKNSSDIRLLSSEKGFGSAGKNFFYLLKNADFNDYDYIAFSDQDDIWHPDKIVSAIECLLKFSCDGYSGNVTAFYSDGRKVLLNKSQPQTEFDYLFEGAGPGCTYVISHKLASLVKEQLIKHDVTVDSIELHDWLTYAIARSHGMKWYIDSRPFLLYRQHENNSLGAHLGISAIRYRLKLLKSGWYRRQVNAISTAVNMDSHPFLMMALNKSYIGRLYLAIHSYKIRRRKKEALALAFLALIGWF
jgi:rhamnosyltransferase